MRIIRPARKRKGRRKEKDSHEFETRRAQASGEVIRKTSYYGESFHITLEYVGHRNDLLTVFGPKDALAILARLTACDEVLSARSKTGAGLAAGFIADLRGRFKRRPRLLSDNRAHGTGDSSG